MPAPFLKSVAIGASALGLSLMAHSALANLLTNGSFETHGTLSTGTQNLVNFAAAGVTGWSISSTTSLTYLDNPGTEFTTNYLPVYGPAGNIGTDPDAGAFVESDGNPNYGAVISQTLTGLAVGTAYTVSFYQAAGQQTGFSGATTEQWAIDLTNGSTAPNVSGFISAATQYSNLMSTGSEGLTPWQKSSLTFVATSATETLSFLAWGDGGSTVNLPPIVFLDGVDVEKAPEPVSMSLMGAGLLGLGAVRWRRRAKRA